MSNDTGDPPVSNTRLERLLSAALSGIINVDSPARAKDFLSCLGHLADHSAVLDRLVSDRGLSCVRTALSLDVSLSGITQIAVPFLVTLQDPALAVSGKASALSTLVNCIHQTSTLFDRLIQHFKAGELNGVGQKAVVWLTLNLCAHDFGQFRDLAQKIQLLTVKSFYVPVRRLGERLKGLLDLPEDQHPGNHSVPGWRHDNDFMDFQQISLMPTPEEISDTRQPYLLTFEEAFDAIGKSLHQGERMYFEHLFRLSRADMLYDFKEALKPEKITFTATNLSLVDPVWKVKKYRMKTNLRFSASEPLPQLAHLETEQERSRHLQEVQQIFKQGFPVAIYSGESIIAFGIAKRRVEELCLDEPVFTLDVEPEALKQVMLAHSKSFELRQLRTPVFAYRNALLRLQNMQELPLADEILFWKAGTEPALIELPESLEEMVWQIKEDREVDIGAHLHLASPINLDRAQLRALHIGLTRKLAIIQGPPG